MQNWLPKNNFSIRSLFAASSIAICKYSCIIDTSDLIRNALKRLKREAPDFIVAEFFYGYGNNYAGVHISNLDVLLYSLQKYAPRAKVILFSVRRNISLSASSTTSTPFTGC